MQNILDYLDWRGDLDFSRDAFNEVDNLILSVLSYIRFDDIVPGIPGAGSISLAEAAERYAAICDQLPSLDHNPFFKQIPELLQQAARSIRYRDVQLSNYVNQIEIENTKQFSAVTFSINRRLHFLAYRGTDDTLIGWKEDFLMSFMEEVEAQKQANFYLKQVATRLWGKFYLGGHSKGGNLAVYAATHAPEKVRRRILEIFSNDGPGFQPHIIQQEGYQRILPRIRTLIPKSSVVGLLLEHCEDYKVIGSNEQGLMQHNAFSWSVRGTCFVAEKGLTPDSISLNETLRSWLSQLSMEQREQFIEALFEMIDASGVRTIGEFSKEKISHAMKMIKTYRSMDSETQQQLKNATELFFKESQKVIKDSISSNFDQLLTNIKAKAEKVKEKEIVKDKDLPES